MSLGAPGSVIVVIIEKLERDETAIDLLERLLAHDRWATNILFDACSLLTDAQSNQAFDIGHETIHATFGHLIGNVIYWTDSMKGAEADRDQDWSRSSLRPRFPQAYDEFERFALGIQADGRFDETFTDSWDTKRTLGAASLHVNLHEDEYRQEILHILNRLGVESVPEIDHALWDFVRRGLYSPDSN